MKIKYSINGVTYRFGLKEIYEASMLAKNTAHKEWSKEEFRKHYNECLLTVKEGNKNA